MDDGRTENGEPGSSWKSLGHNTKPRNTNFQQG